MNTSTPRILLIEDETMLAHNIARYLTRRGLCTALADCVERGRNLCESARYDVIVLDVNLPDGNGLELYAQMRERINDTRVIAITGNPSDAVHDRASQLGIDDVFTKPFALSALARTIIESLSWGDCPPAELAAG